MSSSIPKVQNILIQAMTAQPLMFSSMLCRLCQECRCDIIASRLTRHDGMGALTLEVTGSWDALVRLENALAGLKKNENTLLNHTRISRQQETARELPYMAFVSARYHPDTLTELCLFFSNMRVDLQSIQYDSFTAPQSGTLMLNATLTISVPDDVSISWLREQFLDFADALNLDAMLEPWRPQQF